MRLKFAHLCDSTIISVEQKLSIIGIFTNTHTDRIPYIHAKMELALGLQIEPDDIGKTHAVSVVMLSPDGVRMRQVDGGVEVDESARFLGCVNLAIPFLGVQFNDFGAHRIDVFLDGKQVEGIEFEVLKA
jgi:hypothetical protein